MAIYKVKYLRKSEYIMEVEATSHKEALQKYINVDYTENYEVQKIDETLLDIKRVNKKK